MAITRRTFLVGSAALGAGMVAGAPTEAESLPRLPFLEVGPTFTTAARRFADPGWLDVCATFSEWQFATASYRQPLLRHRETGLTYRLAFDEDGELEASGPALEVEDPVDRLFAPRVGREPVDGVCRIHHQKPSAYRLGGQANRVAVHRKETRPHRNPRSDREI